VGCYNVPDDFATGTHPFTIEASARGIVTDIPVQFANEAQDSGNTGMTAPGKFGVDSDPCSAAEICPEEIPCAVAPAYVSIDRLCYRVIAKPTLTLATRHLADRFEAGDVKVRRPKHLCVPASVDGAEVPTPDAYQQQYVIEAHGHVKQKGISVHDRFGTLVVDTIRPQQLFVPTNLTMGGPATAPPLGTDNHFKCYWIKTAAGTPKFPTDVQATVSTQFETRLYEVQRPIRLCTPVDKNGEGIVEPSAHLMCYLVRRASGQPKHVRVLDQIQTNNQFGPLALDTYEAMELCVPATVP
jgi:hypothetical protein